MIIYFNHICITWGFGVLGRTGDYTTPQVREIASSLTGMLTFSLRDTSGRQRPIGVISPSAVMRHWRSTPG